MPAKVELVIAILHYAGKSGLLDLNNGVHSLSSKTKIPVTALKGLLRDRDLFYGKYGEWTDSEFLEWLKNNDCTSVEDARKGIVVYKILSHNIDFRLKSYLEKMAIVPDSKNNKELIVFDLEVLANDIARHSIKKSAKEIMIELITTISSYSDSDKLERLKKKTIKQMIADATIEQSQDRIGVKTTELILEIFKKIISCRSI